MCTQQEISLDGLTLIPVRTSASSIGSSRNGKGQTAALNMLGQRRPFADVPFFWSQHYDVPINYVGHADSWDEIAIDGDIMSKDCVLRYMRKGRVMAVASIFRDLESLKAEVMLERALG